MNKRKLNAFVKQLQKLSEDFEEFIDNAQDALDGKSETYQNGMHGEIDQQVIDAVETSQMTINDATSELEDIQNIDL